MMTQIKSEFRKLMSVRSTYVMLAIALALITLIAYLGTSATIYDEGVCEKTGEVVYSKDYTAYDESAIGGMPSSEELCEGQILVSTKTDTELPKDKLLYSLQETVPLISIFATVVVVLLMAHEFRYNTINYTLTISRSRSKVLLSKLLVSVLLTVLFMLLAIGVSLVVTQIAMSIKGLTLPPQDYNWPYILARHLGYTLGQTLFFLGVITLVRSLTAGIAAIFLLPTVEQIGGFLLASRDIEPAKLLPFSALNRFGSVASDVTSMQGPAEFATSSGQVSVMIAGLVALVWIIGLWVVTWLLFLRRDAN